MDYYLLVSRRRNQNWTAESAPLTESWVAVCDRIKALELERPGCEVAAIWAHSEHELKMKLDLIEIGGAIQTLTYQCSDEDRKRLQMEMSDGEPIDQPYHYRGILDMRDWIQLQARVTRGELGGPNDGDERIQQVHGERRYPEEPAA